MLAQHNHSQMRIQQISFRFCYTDASAVASHMRAKIADEQLSIHQKLPGFLHNNELQQQLKLHNFSDVHLFALRYLAAACKYSVNINIT